MHEIKYVTFENKTVGMIVMLWIAHKYRQAT